MTALFEYVIMISIHVPVNANFDSDCSLLIILANSLYPDQANRPYLDPNRFTLFGHEDFF